ncbi:MAG: MBL fold metallo-hydrolase [Lentisphaerae bacterium]|jgi:phosphoribosyl 1,2-cyclic phosphate phosphodiesterase|nr:MBL fold metallo-hydrolase [Lentisphaerota bacterium]
MGYRVTILGSGTSYGVPVIGCDCAVCRSSDSRDRRRRTAALISCGETRLLIDVGPDFREQALAFGISKLDGVLLTHTHADHLHGLDDLRAVTLRSRKELPFYGNGENLEFVRKHFSYIFKDDDFSLGWGIPRLSLVPIGDEAFEVGDIAVQPVPLCHGRWNATGYRVGSFAYLADCSGIPESSFQLLEGVETVVIDALHWREHPTHLSFEQAFALNARLGARRMVLTHLTHEISYREDSAKLPPFAELAYDGLEIEFS